MFSWIEGRHFLFMDRGQTFFFNGWSQDIFFTHGQGQNIFFCQNQSQNIFFKKNPRPPPPPLGSLMVAPLGAGQVKKRGVFTAAHTYTEHICEYPPPPPPPGGDTPLSVPPRSAVRASNKGFALVYDNSRSAFHQIMDPPLYV